MEEGERCRKSMEEAEKGIDSKREMEGRRVESLGWLTESSVMPKKQKAIGGVGPSSIVELRAELYRTQEDVKRLKQGDQEVEKHRARKTTDVFSKKNVGVEDRAHRDKLQLKAVNDGSASYAALEKKSELYDKLVNGELPDEEESERYNVDFLRKGFLAEEDSHLETSIKSCSEVDERTSNDTVIAEATFSGTGWSREGAGSNQSYKDLIKEVNVETKEAREKALLLKQRRQMIAEKSKEKLRQAFLKKQIEKLKSAGNRGMK